MEYFGQQPSGDWAVRTAWMGLVCWLLAAAPAFGMQAPSSALIAPSDTDQAAVRVSLAASLFNQNGDMTYTIQGPEDGGWKSELAWPIRRILYGGGVVSTTVANRYHLNIGGWTSLTDEAGSMKDSDWFDSLSALLLALYGDDTAIYGEFDSTLDALLFDGNLRVDVVQRSAMTLGLVAGYAYTQFEWTAGNGYQRSPISRFNVGSVTGTGIIYEQRLKTPYLGLAASFAPSGSLALNVHAAYSPLVECRDEDDHVLRYKKSTGTTDGSYLGVGGDIHWRFAPGWDVAGLMQYTKYDLEGSQDQVFYGGTNMGTRFSDIDLTITGTQLALGMLVRYSF